MPQLEDYLERPRNKDVPKLEKQSSGVNSAWGGNRIVAEGLAALIAITALCVGSVVIASWMIQTTAHMLPVLWHTVTGT